MLLSLENKRSPPDGGQRALHWMAIFKFKTYAAISRHQFLGKSTFKDPRKKITLSSDYILIIWPKTVWLP